MATPQRGAAPSAPDHVVTKDYVDDAIAAVEGGSGGAPTFIQQTEPVVTGPAVWYQTNGSNVIIKKWVQTT